MERTADQRLIKWLDTVNTQQLPRNLNWIDNQIKKGRLNHKWHNFLIFVMESLEIIYPERWDLQFNIYNHYTTETYENYAGYEYVITHNQVQYIFEVIIKFPDINITNSAGFKHNIKDLYVKVQFVYCDEIDNFIPFNIGGTRGKVTDVEAYCSYMHSHLQFMAGAFYPFCIGDRESSFGSVMMECIDNLNKENFQALMYMVETLVAWESLEGVPFHKIGELNANETTLPNLLNSDKQYYMEKLLEFRRENRMDINWKYEDSVKINDDEVFEQFVKLSDSVGDYINRNFLVGKSANGEYINISKRKNLPNQQQLERTFVFNATNIRLEIIKTTADTLSTIYIHPSIKSYIKNHLENEAAKHIKRSNREKRISKFGYPE